MIWAKAILSNAKPTIWQHETWIHGVRVKAGGMGDSGATDRATCGRQKYVIQFIIQAFDRGENTYMPTVPFTLQSLGVFSAVGLLCWCALPLTVLNLLKIAGAVVLTGRLSKVVK